MRITRQEDETSPVVRMTGTPRAHGYRMPAEWNRHEATWIGWPHNRHDWPGKFAPIPWVFAEMVRHIAEGEKVRVLVQSAEHEQRATHTLRRAHANLAQVEFFRARTDRGWTRDFGPIFVTRGGRRPGKAIVDFRFNAWAKYPDWQLDNKVAGLVARAHRRPRFDASSFTLEGGAIEVNGRGTLITTEECLLQQEVQVRNPGYSRADMDRAFREYLGARQVWWLGRGIAGDDTHGHVDDLCRFVSSDTVVLVREDNPRDENYRALAENFDRVASCRLDNGRKPTVVPLPMPRPLYFEGRRIPASYANFYICNAAVLVPTFNDPRDRLALGILAELMPDRPVIGIHAVDLVWGFGTIHCLTQQEPAL